MAELAPMQDRLAQELRQHQFLENLYQHFRQSVPQQGLLARHKVVTEKCFGRLLQTVQYFTPPEQHAVYPLLPRQPVANNIRSELIRMLREDLRVDEDMAIRISDDVFERISEFLNEDHADEALPDVVVRYRENGNCGKISVGAFNTKDCPRVRYLARTFGNDETALMCLRYDSLSKFRGGESGMSVTGLNALHDVGQVTFEGFSSPLNCRLLGREGVRFCSLFDDTDAAFGSLGNFFRIELTDYPGGWSLGPPFVEIMLNATADRVLATLHDTKPGEFWFFVTFPHWDDNPGWRKLEESPRKVARIDFDKREFWRQDNYGKFFRPDVRICIFVLGQLPDEVDLIELRNRIGDVDEARVRADWLVACDVAD